MIEEIVTLVGHQKRFRRIRVETQLESRLPSLQLDPSQMQQLLYNMLNNAAEAIGSDRDNGRIAICTALASDKLAVRLDIADNGCGLKAEDQQRAFRDRFTRRRRAMASDSWSVRGSSPTMEDCVSRFCGGKWRDFSHYHSDNLGRESGPPNNQGGSLLTRPCVYRSKPRTVSTYFSSVIFLTSLNAPEVSL